MQTAARQIGGYVDSSGVGELVKTYTMVRNHGGQLKLLTPASG